MSRRGNATLIGAFVVVGLGLLLALVILIGGGRLFARKEHVVMHFSGSIYGLQVGAPVVFRGVRLGSVTSIGVVYDRARDDFSIPVRADLEPEAIRGLGDSKAGDGRSEVLDALLQRGLSAQLAMQSLLTGQLYIDLDLRPGKPAQRLGQERSLQEIPTSATAIQNLKNQIDGLDVRRLVDDVSTIAASARSLLTMPELRETLGNVAAITAHVRELSGQVQRRFGPLADSATHTSEKVGAAAEQVGDSARRIGGTAERYKALVADDAPLLRDVQQMAAELAQLAGSLRRQTSDDAGLMQQLDGALRDVSSAARSVRELSELLNRQPQALLRGRAASPSMPSTTPKTSTAATPGPAASAPQERPP